MIPGMCLFAIQVHSHSTISQEYSSESAKTACRVTCEPLRENWKYQGTSEKAPKFLSKLAATFLNGSLMRRPVMAKIAIGCRRLASSMIKMRNINHVHA